MGRLSQPRFGLDYAWTTIAPGEHRKIDSTFACRYVSPDPSKNITFSEAKELRFGGVDVVAVWESTANRASQGRDAGVTDATRARSLAVGAGMPPDRPIYFAVDFDTAGNPGQVDAYFDGVASVLGKARSGPYGGLEVVSHLLDRGFAYAWQTYAWSGGKWDSRAQIQQFSNARTVAGSDCDFDRAMFDDFGQWGYQAKPDQHYDWLPKTRVLSPFGRVNEYDTVVEWDRHVRDRRAPRARLLRARLLWLAGRVWAVAHRHPGHPDWNTARRGWRFHELRRRALNH